MQDALLRLSGVTDFNALREAIRDAASCTLPGLVSFSSMCFRVLKITACQSGVIFFFFKLGELWPLDKTTKGHQSQLVVKNTLKVDNDLRAPWPNPKSAGNGLSVLVEIQALMLVKLILKWLQIIDVWTIFLIKG